MQSNSTLRALWYFGMLFIAFVCLILANCNGVSGYFSSLESIVFFKDLGIWYYGEFVVFFMVISCIFYCVIGNSLAGNGVRTFIFFFVVAIFLTSVSYLSLNAIAFNNLYAKKVVQDYLSGNINKGTYSKLMKYVYEKNNLLNEEEKSRRMKEVQPIILQLNNGDFGFIEKQNLSIKNPFNAPLLTDDEYYPAVSSKDSPKKEKLNSDFIDSSYRSSDLPLNTSKVEPTKYKNPNKENKSDIVVKEIVENIFCDKPCSNEKGCSGVASECKKSSCSSDCN